MSTDRLLARTAAVLAGVPFVVLGAGAAREPGKRTELAAGIGIPNPELAVRANGAAMVAGGLALAAGVLPRAAALGLVASLVPTTIAGHPYWSREDPLQRTLDRIQVMKNIGLAGGAIAAALALDAAE